VSEEQERTAVYRIRGEADVLLYIGMTNGPGIRWNAHQLVQPWWDELRSLTVEWYNSRPEAEAAEKAAIPAEQPKYNITYLKPARPGREREPREIVALDLRNVEIKPLDGDDDLLNLEDVAGMARMSSASGASQALKRTGGPKGFKLGDSRLFRRGEIRKWIAAAEASQAGTAA
jgi:hypothetical protein